MDFSIKSFDAKNPLNALKTACLAVAVFEDGKLSEAALQADRSGEISAAVKSGDISGKPGTTLLLRGNGHPRRAHPAGRAGQARCHLRQGFYQRAASSGARTGQPGRRRCRDRPALGANQGARPFLGRARRRAGRARARLPLRRHEEQEGTGAARRKENRFRARAASRRAGKSRSRRKRGHGQRHGPDARPRQPAAQCLHPDLSGADREKARARIRIWRRSARPQATASPENGQLPVRHPRHRRAAQIHRPEARGRQDQGCAGGPGRQGHHFRFRRHLAQAGRRHG